MISLSEVILFDLLTVLSPPFIMLFIGGWLMTYWSKREVALAALRQNPCLRVPLNQRFCGYSPNTAKRYIATLSSTTDAMDAEIRFIKLDLWFPFFYGAAFSWSLSWAWSNPRLPFAMECWLDPLVLILLVSMAADWTENLIQLTQLKSWPDVQELWLRLASYSTMIKLWFMLILCIGIVLAVVMSVFGRDI